MNEYYVYIMSSFSYVLYIGVTNNLEARVFQHKQELIDGFTKRYHVTFLVFFEATDDISAAIQREKQIKGWSRKKKIALVKTMNPEWKDLSEGWYS